MSPGEPSKLASPAYVLTPRIIEPVASRCSKFRFRPLEQSSSQARIEMIAGNEGVDADPGVLELILKLAGGDLRKAITYLQTAQRLHQTSDPPTPITAMSGESSTARSRCA